MIAIIGIIISSVLFLLEINIWLCLIVATISCIAEYVPYMKGDKNDN